MRNLSKVALALAGVAGLAGMAAAADRNSHVMTVALPGGGVAHVTYVGDVAPQIKIIPAVPVVSQQVGIPAGAMFGFDPMLDQMDREMAATMQQIDALARQPVDAGGTGANLAAYGDVPAGASSYSVVTVSDNGHECTRSTQVIGQGAGKAPKVINKTSGDCGPAASQPVKPSAPALKIPDGPIHQS